MVPPINGRNGSTVGNSQPVATSIDVLLQDDYQELIPLLPVDQPKPDSEDDPGAPDRTSEQPTGIPAWTVYNLRDAYQERPPTRYIIDGILRIPSLNIVFGAPGDLKSLVLNDACASVVIGQPWLSAESDEVSTGFATLQSPVLWIDFDNGELLTHERIQAVARAHALPESAPFYYVTMPEPRLDMSDPSQVDPLAEFITQRGIKLVVIDNLGLISGGVDENSPAMVDVMGNLRRLAEKADACIVIIHHQRKGNTSSGRQGDSLRGHSSIEAALDVALLVQREAGTDRLTLHGTKVRGPGFLPFGAVFSYEHKPGTKELYKARFSAPPDGVATPEQKARKAILEVVRANPNINKTSLQGLLSDRYDLGMSKTKIGNLAEKMVGEGKLTLARGANNAKLLHIA